MKERVLITGASGFVGFHLVNEALKNNLEVYVAVRKTSKTDHLVKAGVNFVFTDLSDISSLEKEINTNGFDYIIHAAGVTKARSKEEYEYVNAGLTYNIAAAVSQSSNKLKKFVLISSLAALGPLHRLEGIITEDTVPQPVTSYGKSKLFAEENLRKFSKINSTILRPTAVYGPRDRDIFIFFKQLAGGIEPYIGRMEQKLSFIYVTDLAKAAVEALHIGHQQTFNLSDGNCYSRYALADICKDVLKSRTLKLHLPVNFVTIIAGLSEKYSSLRNRASALNVEKLNELMAVNWDCDIRLAKAELGFAPEYDLKAGVTETLLWYKNNKWL